MEFLLAFFGIFVATITLGLYVYAAYSSGDWLGKRADLNRPLWVGIGLIAAFWLPLSLWTFLTDWDRFLKVAIAMAFYLLNAWPAAIGFGAAVEMRREQAKKRFRKNVDDWLGEWECEPAEHSMGEEE